jgi:hypothetical protein
VPATLLVMLNLQYSFDLDLALKWLVEMVKQS